MTYEKETTYQDWFIDHEPAIDMRTQSLCIRISHDDCAFVAADEFVNLPVGFLTLFTLWLLISTSQVR